MRLVLSYGETPENVKKLSRATTRCDFPSESLDQDIHGHLSEILTAACTHGHQSVRLFLVAHDELIRQPVQAMFADFIGNFLVAQIRLGPETRPMQLLRNIRGVVGLLLGNVQDDGLERRQPQAAARRRSSRSGCR